MSKRLRSLRKKLNRIGQIEERKAAGQAINKEQGDVLKSKGTVVLLIEEYEKLKQPLLTAVKEEVAECEKGLSLALQNRSHGGSDPTQGGGAGNGAGSGSGEVGEGGEGKGGEGGRVGVPMGPRRETGRRVPGQGQRGRGAKGGSLGVHRWTPWYSSCTWQHSLTSGSPGLRSSCGGAMNRSATRASLTTL